MKRKIEEEKAHPKFGFDKDSEDLDNISDYLEEKEEIEKKGYVSYGTKSKINYSDINQNSAEDGPTIPMTIPMNTEPIENKDFIKKIMRKKFPGNQKQKK